jgi:hypothetical protein
MPPEAFAKEWHDRRRPGDKARSRITIRREDRTRLAKTAGRARVKAPSCEDCYFRKNLLCALELDEPCATFRPDRPEGLVPPRQPVLLMRSPRWAGRVQQGPSLAATGAASREI